MQSPPLSPSSASCFTSITLKNNFWLNKVLNWHQYNLCKIYLEGFRRTFNSSLSPCCWSASHRQISLHLSFFYLSLSSRNINQAQHPRPTCEHLISHQFFIVRRFFWLAILLLYLLRCFSVIYENMLWCFIRISRHRSHSTSSSGSSSDDSDSDSSDSDSDSSGSDTNNNTKDKSIKSPLKSPSSSPKVRVLLGENCKIKSQLQSIIGCHLSIKIESRLWLHVLESRIFQEVVYY